MLKLDSVTYTNEEYDGIVETARDEGLNPTQLLAQSAAAKQSPDVATYESLRDGTAPVFTQPGVSIAIPDEGFSDLEIVQMLIRGVDDQRPIPGSPVVDDEVQRQTGVARGVKQQAIPAAVGTAGGYAGYKAGQALAAAIPPVGPYAAAAKMLIPFATGTYGYVQGLDLGQGIKETTMGPDPLYIPGTTADVEAGKTLADVGPMMAMPFLMGLSGKAGPVTEFLTTRQLNAEAAKKFNDQFIGPMRRADFKKRRNQDLLQDSSGFFSKKGDIKKPSLALRGLGKIEEGISSTGKLARSKPVETIALETLAGTGATLGAGFAEETDPGDALARVGFETAGGITGGSLVPAAVKIAAAPITLLKNTLKSEARGEYAALREEQGFVRGTQSFLKGLYQPFKDRQTISLVNDLIDRIEDAQAQGLGEPELDTIIENLLMDHVDVTGAPVDVTAGSAAGSFVIAAMENALGPALGTKRLNAAKKAIELMARKVDADISVGDKESYKRAAQAVYDSTLQGMGAELDRATNQVIQAHSRLKTRRDQGIQTGIETTEDLVREPEEVRSMAELGKSLQEIVQNQYNAARNQADRLWRQTEDIEIPGDSFKNAAGEPIDRPYFIEVYDNQIESRFGGSSEGVLIDEAFLNKFGPQIKYILQKKKSLDLPLTDADEAFIDQLKLRNEFDKIDYDRGFEPGTRNLRTTPEGLEIPERPLEDVLAGYRTSGYSPVISTKGLQNNLQNTRNKAVSLFSGPTKDPDHSFGFALADAFRIDLQNVPDEVVGEQYLIAREFTRAMHDTFTRSITGKMLSKKRDMDHAISPDVVIKSLFGGRDDVTASRINDILNISDFASRAAGEGAEGAEEAALTVRQVVNDLIRSIAADKQLVDPVTTEISSPTALNTWRKQNAELLALFPDIAEDMRTLKGANDLLNTANGVELDAVTGLPVIDSATGLPKKTETVKQRNTYLAEKLKEYGAAQRVLKGASPARQVKEVMNSPNPPAGLRNMLELLTEAETVRYKEGLSEGLSETAARAGAVEFKQKAAGGLRDSIFEYAMEQAGGAQELKPSKMIKFLFDPIPQVGAEPDFVKNFKGTNVAKPSLADFLEFNKLASPQMLKNIEQALVEMMRYEIASTTGNLQEVLKESGPLLDLYLRVSGAAIGTRMAAALGGSELIGAGAGSKFMREMVSNVPNAFRMDVMLELFNNPKELGRLLQKGKQQKETYGGIQGFAEILTRMGLRPFRRAVPSTAREVEQELETDEFKQQQEEAFKAQQPVTMTAPPQQPAAQVAMNMDTQPTVPVSRPTAPPASPQQRQQYAAMYPFDPVSELIRTGRG